ncbi:MULTISPECIES: ATP-grasp domain-containing protein [unclassified Janthinobacterium]|uniref:ATP-grasp domain-containing protein n=1 Tax=unclassified Janthinobacterium TaxID=2610881 RepID=UPI0016203FFE|nr:MULTISPECIES: ATP-grasp domain-containing protein [unclassified Janthinobacterium]MBB5369409.1 biotin carboxylase [Janthinobacterium sp. K2C7]MBB5381055.1 biotin carboxylase [Janthinobacterium sp. K2Li3]MBB5387792.1 biotin carboxylase [Janthinobacterium sp. K2E3]
MHRVWFNKTFSSVATAMRLIREADLLATNGKPRYHLVCSNTNAHAAAFLEAHEYAVEPAGLTGVAYVEWCLDFCRTREITIFWPGKEAGRIASASARFAAIGVRLLSVASEEVLALMHDKARFCDGLDLPMARPADYRAVNTIAEYDAAYAELRPLHRTLCIKPSESVYGLGFAVLDEVRSSAQLLLAGAAYQINAQELRSGLAQMQTFKTLLLMEYLDGHEYSADCVADQGRLVCAIPRKKLHAAGSGQLIELRKDLLAACTKLARDYQLNGVFNIQFREGANGLALLEINPRMSGGIGMACAAGPNLPYLALAGFDQGYDKLTVPPVREGMRVAETAHAVELP